MSLPAKHRQLPESIKRFSPFISICIGLWGAGIVGFALFAFNTLENSARTSTEDIATLLETTIDNEQELLATRAQIIGESQTIREFIDDSSNYQKIQALSDIKQRHNLDFIQVFTPQNDRLLTTTLDNQALSQNLAKISLTQQLVEDQQSGFFISEDNQTIFLAGIAEVEFDDFSTGYISVGKTLDQSQLEDLRKNASLHLLLQTQNIFIASTLNYADLQSIDFQNDVENKPFWESLGGEDYLIRRLRFTSFDQKSFNLYVLNPATTTEQVETQLWVLAGLFGVLGIIALYTVIIWNSKSVKRLKERIKAISDATEELSQGNSYTLINVDSDDNFGRLADSFNLMAEKLQERESQLQEKVVLLEETLKELGQTQNQIVQSEKMAALGQMMAGIAHEINNPLGFIYGNLPHIQDYCAELMEAIAIHEKQNRLRMNSCSDSYGDLDISFITQDLPKVIDSVKTGADRIQVILKSLRKFSHLDESEYKSINLHENIDSVLLILKHRLRAIAHCPEIHVEKNYGELPSIACFAGELNQVFLHIISNAVDAIQDKYHTNHASLEDNLKEVISITTKQLDHEYVQVAIANTGRPISAKIKERLFEPFFSTKPIGKGTGLGLSISYQIVHDIHKGKIWCEINKNKETIFYLKIPINQSVNITHPVIDGI